MQEEELVDMEVMEVMDPTEPQVLMAQMQPHIDAEQMEVLEEPVAMVAMLQVELLEAMEDLFK